MKKPITPEELKLIEETYSEMKNHECLQKIYRTPQHRTSNTYRHVSWVAKESIKWCIKKCKHYDFHSLIRGAFLHDLFFYDWRKDKKAMRGHLHAHPDRALNNAKKYFELTPTEVDIIRCHMWPINLFRFPKTPEGRLVMKMDKKVFWMEILHKKKHLLIFDLDGTLLNTLPDLNKAVNYSLEKNGFSTKDMEHTRLAIGNGVAMLIKRSLPEDVNDEIYQKVLNDFREYYEQHYCENTTAYEGMFDTLTSLRRRGYRLAVSTNKREDIANELVEKFYPGLFETVCGDDNKRKKKPSADSIKEIMKRLKVRNKSRVTYIGDTEVDFQTAKNGFVNNILVTYGYRTFQELVERNLNILNFAEKPEDLKDLFALKTKKRNID